MGNSKEYNQKYYSEHKQGLQKITCEICGKTICSNALKIHMKSSKCQLIKTQKQLQEITNEPKDILYSV